jgi:hypothetical protein
VVVLSDLVDRVVVVTEHLLQQLLGMALSILALAVVVEVVLRERPLVALVATTITTHKLAVKALLIQV